jgi:hypothetical protein
MVEIFTKYFTKDNIIELQAQLRVDASTSDKVVNSNAKETT